MPQNYSMETRSERVIASTKLPKEKFDPACDQVMAAGIHPGSADSALLQQRCGYSSVALPGSVQSFGRGMPENGERRKRLICNRRRAWWAVYRISARYFHHEIASWTASQRRGYEGI